MICCSANSSIVCFLNKIAWFILSKAFFMSRKIPLQIFVHIAIESITIILVFTGCYNIDFYKNNIGYTIRNVSTRFKQISKNI